MCTHAGAQICLKSLVVRMCQGERIRERCEKSEGTESDSFNAYMRVLLLFSLLLFLNSNTRQHKHPTRHKEKNSFQVKTWDFHKCQFMFFTCFLLFQSTFSTKYY